MWCTGVLVEGSREDKEKGVRRGHTVFSLVSCSRSQVQFIEGKEGTTAFLEGKMDPSGREGDDIISMQSQHEAVPRRAPSTSNSRSFRRRSGSDGTCVSGQSMSTSSRGDCSDDTSLEDEENENDAADSNANEAKIADVDFDVKHNLHAKHVGRLVIDGNSVGGERAGTGGADTDVRIDQTKQKTAGQTEDAAEISAVKQALHLIRSVEIEALCLWDGDSRNEPVTDVRIMMVVCIMMFLPSV